MIHVTYSLTKKVQNNKNEFHILMIKTTIYYDCCLVDGILDKKKTKSVGLNLFFFLMFKI